MNSIVNLEEEMCKNSRIIDICQSVELAEDFYRALCNQTWYKIHKLTQEEKNLIVIERLRGNYDINSWSVSWRCAGEIISTIRNRHYDVNENYLDFYCSGNEGFISDLVKDCFLEMGWHNSAE